MPDIAKCQGLDCPDRYRCYRYLAPESTDGQPYGMFDWLRVDGFECEGFVAIRPDMGELSGISG